MYAILFDGVVAYVGSSAYLRWRINAHKLRPGYIVDTFHTPWGLFRVRDLVVKIKPSIRRGEWLYDEYRLIARLRPVFNIRGMRRGAAYGRT